MINLKKAPKMTQNIIAKVQRIKDLMKRSRNNNLSLSKSKMLQTNSIIVQSNRSLFYNHLWTRNIIPKFKAKPFHLNTYSKV